MNKGDVPGRLAIGSWLTGITDGTSTLVLFVLMVMTCIDVVGRYFFNAPLDGATELTQLMMGVIVFAVLPTVSIREEHVTVDLLDMWFPAKLINARQLALNVMVAVMMAAVAWRVWVIADLTAEYGDATEFLAIPLAPITYFIAIMSGATALALIVNIVRYARGAGRLSPGGDGTPPSVRAIE